MSCGIEQDSGKLGCWGQKNASDLKKLFKVHDDQVWAKIVWAKIVLSSQQWIFAIDKDGRLYCSGVPMCHVHVNCRYCDSWTEQFSNMVELQQKGEESGLYTEEFLRCKSLRV